MNIVIVYWTIQLYCLLYIKVYKSFEPAYLCLSLIGAYYCVGLYCLIHRSTGIPVPVPVPEQHFCSGSGEHF